MQIRSIASALALAISGSASAATLSSLGTFGGGDGWRAPGEIVTGDTAGTATGSTYNYLGTGSLERGLAYNRATGHLILVSRSTAGNGIRILDGATGADIGALNQGSGVISGGTFTTNMVAVGADGAIYVNNLTATASSSAHKIYQWTNEAAAAPTVFASAFASAFRLGDSLDATGSGASTRLAAGYSGTTGYAVYDNTGALSDVTPITGPVSGDFRLGITFAQSGSDVWGKQTGAANLLRRTTYSGSTGTLAGSNAPTSSSEALMDYATIAGVPYLATQDITSSLVRVYDASDPANLVVVASGNLTTTPAANGNGVGNVQWGAIDDVTATATLYAMSSNQGIQAFTFVVPEPAGAVLVAGLLAPLLLGRARRRSR